MKRTLTLALTLLAMMAAGAQNPYLPLWEHLPDGEPRVFEDPDQPGKFRAYIIGSHDVHYDKYCGNDVRMWSAPVEDLSQWRDEGPIFSWFVNGQWDTMYAPDLVSTTDRQTGRKTYWLYPHSRGWGRIAMVCKGDRPNGPFTPVNLTADGTRCVEGSLIDFDPSVFIEPVNDKKDPDYDKGFRAYVFYGFQHSTACQLDQNTMYSKRPGTELIDPFIPASSRDGKLLDKEGSEYKALYKGQNPLDFNFFEASSIRQVGNKYVMVFSGYSGKEYGLGNTNSALRYAYGDSPLGPWRSGGVLVDSRGVVPSEDGTRLITTNAGHNTHGSLQEINGQWYVFYHRPPRGFGNARQAMVAPVKIEWDKKPVAKGGRVRITGYDPFAPNNEWTAKATPKPSSASTVSGGFAAETTLEYTGAEVTSEGFQIFGLPCYGYYSAGIACYMAGPNAGQYMQDNHDVWCNSMDLAGLQGGSIIGFKYFNFEGLAQDTKGVKAFKGFNKDYPNSFRLHITTEGGSDKFKVHVKLDDPYKGRDIAVVEDFVTEKKVTRDHSVSLSDETEELLASLKGKHAIYLVVEGPEVKQPEQQRPQWGQRPQQPQRPKGLFTLHGFGFSAGDHQMPTVPEVTITVDGQKLLNPDTPVRATNQNGLMDASTYQLYAPMKQGAKIEVNASDPSVTYEISTGTEYRATVKATYKGKTKTYRIN
ncbi:MAG: hypothetical protein II826_10765 [Prevotella sp.]|nr:hypothetical protein [Prevotella sp.]